MRTPKLCMLVFWAHPAGWPMKAQVSTKELHRRIADACLLQLRKFIQRFERELFESRFAIQSQPGLQLLRLERLTRNIVYALTESIKLCRLHFHSAPHRLPPATP